MYDIGVDRSRLVGELKLAGRDINSFENYAAIISIHTQIVLDDAENGTGISGSTEELAELDLFPTVPSAPN